MDTVTFLASGTRAEVVAFLTDLAAVLRDPRITDEDVRRELPAITAAEVREWLGRWCVADNAVLTLTTPPGDDLDLALPRGTGPVRTVPQPLVRVPTLVQSPRSGVAVSLLVPAVHADLLERAVVGAHAARVRDGVWPGRTVPTFAERRERRGRRGQS